MRYSGENQGVSANFIAGTYVVLMGFDATEEAREGLLGFAVHRVDKTENEQYWLSGFRTFEASYPNPPRGALVSTQQHPVQDFVWSDFTAKPEHEYVYKVVPVYGQPKNLRYRPTCTRVTGSLAGSILHHTRALGAGRYAVFHQHFLVQTMTTMFR